MINLNNLIFIHEKNTRSVKLFYRFIDGFIIDETNKEIIFEKDVLKQFKDLKTIRNER